jgi:hypothetical protein
LFQNYYAEKKNYRGENIKKLDRLEDRPCFSLPPVRRLEPGGVEKRGEGRRRRPSTAVERSPRAGAVVDLFSQWVRLSSIVIVIDMYLINKIILYMVVKLKNKDLLAPGRLIWALASDTFLAT